MERVLINGISSGSVIVDFTVVWPPGYDLDLATQSVDALEEQISTGNVAFSMEDIQGNTIQVSLTALDNVTHQDTVSTSTTTTTGAVEEEEEEEESDPTVLIIVLSTSIPVVLILCIVVILCCRRGKKKAAAALLVDQVATAPTSVRYASILRTV